MEVTGKVTQISEVEEFDSGFRKQLVIIESEDNGFTASYGFEFTKDGVLKLNGIRIGDIIEVGYNLGQCREYKGRWYTNHHRGWKLNKKSTAELPAF